MKNHSSSTTADHLARDPQLEVPMGRASVEFGQNSADSAVFGLAC
jgi:hypothetical protein